MTTILFSIIKSLRGEKGESLSCRERLNAAAKNIAETSEESECLRAVNTQLGFIEEYFRGCQKQLQENSLDTGGQIEATHARTCLIALLLRLGPVLRQRLLKAPDYQEILEISVSWEEMAHTYLEHMMHIFRTKHRVSPSFISASPEKYLSLDKLEVQSVSRTTPEGTAMVPREMLFTLRAGHTNGVAVRQFVMRMPSFATGTLAEFLTFTDDAGCQFNTMLPRCIAATKPNQAEIAARVGEHLETEALAMLRRLPPDIADILCKDPSYFVKALEAVRNRSQ